MEKCLIFAQKRSHLVSNWWHSFLHITTVPRWPCKLANVMGLSQDVQKDHVRCKVQRALQKWVSPLHLNTSYVVVAISYMANDFVIYHCDIWAKTINFNKCTWRCPRKKCRFRWSLETEIEFEKSHISFKINNRMVIAFYVFVVKTASFNSHNMFTFWQISEAKKVFSHFLKLFQVNLMI